MAKNKSRIPLVLSTLATIGATSAALYYKRVAMELREESENDDPYGETFSVNSGVVEAMQRGATLQITFDSTGKAIYKLVND